MLDPQVACRSACKLAKERARLPAGTFRRKIVFDAKGGSWPMTIARDPIAGPDYAATLQDNITETTPNV